VWFVGGCVVLWVLVGGGVVWGVMGGVAGGGVVGGGVVGGGGGGGGGWLLYWRTFLKKQHSGRRVVCRFIKPFEIRTGNTNVLCHSHMAF